MWGEGGEAEAFRFRVMRAAMSATPIADTLAAVILHGVPRRFPKLKLVAVETGSEWVAPLLERIGKVYKQQPKMFNEDPRDVFKRNVWVSPFYENNLDQLGELIGADHMLMGSDWPHTEGLVEPLSFVKVSPNGSALVRPGTLEGVGEGFGQAFGEKVGEESG